MELIGILIFVFVLAHSFYKDYRKKLNAEEKAAAKRFDASNQPSRMSENGVNRQRNTRQTQARQTRQTLNRQSTALVGEGTGWDESDVYAEGRGYSAEGSRSNEGSVPENAMLNGDYFDQEMAANVLELGKELQQMDEMYDREADRFDREVGQLFNEMEDPGKDLHVTTESKKKSRNPREILALSNQDNLKRGILLKEILDKPVAKR